MRFTIFLFFIFLLNISCADKQKTVADLIIHNAYVYTLNKELPKTEAISVKDGKIIFTGNSADALKMKGPDTKVINANKNFVMPGFIEGHGHFSGLGFSLLNLNFLNATSWDEIVKMVEEKVKLSKPGEWIEGRGWHQEKWKSLSYNSVQGYPFHEELSKISPDNPVILYHASGHALYANQKAMEISGVNIETADPKGGRIVRNKKKEAIGVFEEKAMDLIKTTHENYKKTLNTSDLEKRWYEAIALAQKECVKYGVTSFQDAGSKFEELSRYEKMASKNELSIRLWAMVRHNHEVLKNEVHKYKKIGIGNNFYTCNAIKSEVDGALGAFGAWLLEPYSDKPNFHGQNTTDIYEVKKIADLAISNDMQFCVHAIGDRANRVVLDIFEGLASQHPEKKDLRWRIEHAQHLNIADIPRFAKGNIIASIQGIHCTSDAPFVNKRLGEYRSRTGAYVWRSLLKGGVRIANGTDTPVEDLDPIKNFYASVTRKRIDNQYAFYPEQRMSRAEAIKSYTLDNAYAAKEEKLKGSLEVGKLADIVILSKNLFTCKEQDILNTKILFTIVNGKILKTPEN
ncbi:MAG: hypothetical protein RLZZ546_3266 [Bacteroidota bacterium]